MRRALLVWVTGTVMVCMMALPGRAQRQRRPHGHHRLAPLSVPVRDMPQTTASEPPHEHPVLHRPQLGGNSSASSIQNPSADASTPAQPGQNAPTIAGANVEGGGLGLPGFSVNVAPPDTNGAAGRTQYVQLLNSAFTVFDKATHAVLAGPTDTNNLWSTLPNTNPCRTTNDGDGIVLYDHLADRWLITQFANASSSTGPFYECVAVSQTADATGQFFLYYFTYTNFPDYPKLAVWPDAYYVSYNAFNPAGTAFVATVLCALDRTNMLGGAATLRGNDASGAGGNGQVCFQTVGIGANPPSLDFGLLPSDLDGSRLPPAGSPNYFLEWYLNAATAGTPCPTGACLGLWKFHVDFNTETNSTLNGVAWTNGIAQVDDSHLITIPVTGFTPSCGISSTACIPQCNATNCGVNGTTQKLDPLSDRLMYRLAYRNFGDHESLVTNHAVETAGSSTSAIRWYEIQDPNGTPNVVQTGTWAPDSSLRWMGSTAMDKFGNLAIGYSVSSTAMHPAIRYAARLATDSAGTMGNETTLFSGAGSQTGGLSRWGDYSALTLDPNDDCTFWYTNEYIGSNGSFNWHTRIGSFSLGQCQTTPSSISVTPNTGSGAAQTFSFLYADTGGASKITTASGLFNASNSLTSACAFQYNRAANTLQIYDDGGTLVGTTMTPGSGSLSNSQCTLNGAGTTVASAGNSMVVNLSITFTTPAFNGSKTIYMSVADTNGTSTSFAPFGSWTVQ